MHHQRRRSSAIGVSGYKLRAKAGGRKNLRKNRQLLYIA
jgi:hypothetical protein